MKNEAIAILMVRLFGLYILVWAIVNATFVPVNIDNLRGWIQAITNPYQADGVAHAKLSLYFELFRVVFEAAVGILSCRWSREIAAFLSKDLRDTAAN